MMGKVVLASLVDRLIHEECDHECKFDCNIMRELRSEAVDEIERLTSVVGRLRGSNQNLRRRNAGLASIVELHYE